MTKLAPSEKLRIARGYRNDAGRLLSHLSSGKAKECGAEDLVREAHNALCKAFMKIEDAAEAEQFARSGL